MTTTTTQKLVAASLVCMPVTVGVADELRVRARHHDGAVGLGWSCPRRAGTLHAHTGTYAAASWVHYGAAVLTVPMTLIAWRLAVVRSPRWARAVLGTLFALGQFAHLMGELAMTQVFAAGPDPSTLAQLSAAVDRNALSIALIVPFLVGCDARASRPSRGASACTSRTALVDGCRPRGLGRDARRRQLALDDRGMGTAPGGGLRAGRTDDAPGGRGPSGCGSGGPCPPDVHRGRRDETGARRGSRTGLGSQAAALL